MQGYGDRFQQCTFYKSDIFRERVYRTLFVDGVFGKSSGSVERVTAEMLHFIAAVITGPAESTEIHSYSLADLITLLYSTAQSNNSSGSLMSIDTRVFGTFSGQFSQTETPFQYFHVRAADTAVRDFDLN
jgi:hypothetical protein